MNLLAGINIGSLLEKVRKPAGYLGTEINAVHKKIGDVKGCLK